MVVVQHAPQALASLHGSAILEMLVVRHDQPIPEALMIAFDEMVRYEIVHSSS